MKTDADLKKDVMDELAWDPSIQANEVGVAVKDGVVTVTGHLDTFAQQSAIERALRRVAGVKAIAIELDVKIAPHHKRSDTEIALAIEQALRCNALVPVEQIRVTVEGGSVRLQGEVEWDFQRAAVYKAVRPLIGVVDVSNEITLKVRPVPTNIASRIEGALKRQAEREARRVEVLVDGSTVTLRGKVHSWQERGAAQGAAWSAPGVRNVVNDLQIGN